MNGADISAGSKPMRSKSKGKEAPAVAARVVIEIKLIPTAVATNGPCPCHQAKGTTNKAIKSQDDVDNAKNKKNISKDMIITMCIGITLLIVNFTAFGRWY